MDHLADYGVTPIHVYFVLDDHEKEIEKVLNEPNFGFPSFEGFLRKQQWDLNRDGSLVVVAAAEGEKNGQRRAPTTNKYDMPSILQAWLFFALIASTVRTDKPLFELKHLVKGSVRGSKFLTTKTLPEKLQSWHDWMKTSPDVQQRLIDADRTLELARRVVRANLVQPIFTSEIDTSLSSVGANGFTSPKDDEAASDSEEVDMDNDEAPYPELALCLMLLGETLSAAKTQIMNDLGLRINGWLTDDDSGWGPPAYVLKEMKKKKWCQRTQQVLRGQLGSSAFLLFVALEQHMPGHHTNQHDNCNSEKCVVLPGLVSGGNDTSADGKQKLSYAPQHHGVCSKQPKRCYERGPKMRDVLRILRNANPATEAYEFPIFRIITKEDSGRVEGITVETWSRDDERDCRKPDFATISHVWSQGMGNERSNALYECQLKFIRDILEMEEAGIEDEDRKSSDFVKRMVEKTLGKQPEGAKYRLTPPFWMDTLAIPVSDEGGKLKQKAIRQIYHVYNSATRVIVIDKELCETPSSSLASIVIIKILTSAWMRRLWTLQEAFLSRRLSVAFWKNGAVILEDVDDRISRLGTPKDVDTSSTEKGAFYLAMAELIKHKLYHNLMGDDREIRNRKDHPIETRGSMVIASAWRSSRWRSTSRLEDETLALSTLLNLDYQSTLIEQAGEIAKKDPRPEAPVRKRFREMMMRDFWTLIHRNYEGSIPAGLIFLPGEKLSVPGFGWAPVTWLSGKDEDHPYPLNVIGKPTELHQEGLLVRYPGFLLHGGHPTRVLRSNAIIGDLIFPIDQYLSEWYKITATKDHSHDQARQKVINRLRDNANPEPKRPQFGIILSRPKPREWPPEIGLLVEIYSEMSRRKEPRRVNKKIYCCQIICRLWVSRASYKETHLDKETNPASSSRISSGGHDESPIGELMPEDTLWFVDGYQDFKVRDDSRRPKMEGGAEDKKGTMSDNLDEDRLDKLKGYLSKEQAVNGSIDSIGDLPNLRKFKVESNGNSLKQQRSNTTPEIHQSGMADANSIGGQAKWKKWPFIFGGT